jgi:hypothetical protein
LASEAYGFDEEPVPVTSLPVVETKMVWAMQGTDQARLDTMSMAKMQRGFLSM